VGLVFYTRTLGGFDSYYPSTQLQIAKTQRPYVLSATANECQLKVDTLKKTLSGLYSCVVQNKHGKDSVDIELIVKGAPW
jgi:hypothetical protein